MDEERRIKDWFKENRIRMMDCMIFLPTRQSKEKAHKQIWGY